MGRHILVALLGGLLVLGVSTAFAEGPQPTAQEVLKAWGQAPMEVEQVSEPLTIERKRGLIQLTDENLEQISGGMPGVTQQNLNIGGLIDLRREILEDTQRVVNQQLRIGPQGLGINSGFSRGAGGQLP